MPQIQVFRPRLPAGIRLGQQPAFKVIVVIGHTRAELPDPLAQRIVTVCRLPLARGRTCDLRQTPLRPVAVAPATVLRGPPAGVIRIGPARFPLPEPTALGVIAVIFQPLGRCRIGLWNYSSHSRYYSCHASDVLPATSPATAELGRDVHCYLC